MRRSMKFSASLLAIGLALALAACGSTSSSSTGSATASLASSPTGGSTSGAVAQAQATVDGLMKRPTTMVVPALPKKPPTGKTIVFLACGAPVCQAFTPIVQAATNAIGWHTQVIQVGLTPTTLSAGLDQAVQDHPAGVIESGAFPAELISHQLAELKAEHSFAILLDVPDAGNSSGTLLTPADVANQGAAMGKYILADSHGKDAHVAIISTQATPIYAGAHTALKQALASCSSCSVTTLNYAFSDLGTVLASKVETFLQANPTVNYLFFDFAAATDGVPAALATSGELSHVKIIATGIGSTELGYMNANQLQATIIAPFQEALWGAVNVIVRGNMGLPLAPGLNVKLPQFIMTKANEIPTPSAAPPAVVANYQAIFKKAWQVG